jgi:hypothetical protein
MSKIAVETIDHDPDEPAELIGHAVGANGFQVCACECGWDGIRIRNADTLDRKLLKWVRLCPETKVLIVDELTKLRRWTGKLSDADEDILREIKSR